MTPEEKTNKIANFLVNYYKTQGHDITLEQAKHMAENQMTDEQKKQIMEYINTTGSDGSDASQQDEEYLNTPLTDEEAGSIKNGKYTGIVLTVLPEHPNTTFDVEHFVWLVKESVALKIEDKKDILITRFPDLSQDQIDSLIGIFEDEQTKLKKLDKTYPGELAKMKSSYDNAWAQWEYSLSPERQAELKAREEAMAKAQKEEEEKQANLEKMKAQMLDDIEE